MGNCAGIRALAKFGADINVLDFNEIPPILRAVFNCNYEVIRTLCELGARLSWTTTLHNVNNVLKEMAIKGTVEAMRILAASDSPPVDYHPEEIWFGFTAYRGRRHIYGRRFPIEEELAAFKDLLRKKGNKLGIAAETSALRDETLQGIADNDQDMNDEEKTDHFVDALENLPCLSRK